MKHYVWIALLGVIGLADSAFAQDRLAVAVPIPGPPVVDGVLDEPFWAAVEPITGFLQRDPVDGAPASEATEVRIAYTPTALYFGMTMHDSEPNLIRGNILQRGGLITTLTKQ